MKNKSASLLVVSLGKAPVAGFPHLGLVDRWEMAGNSQTKLCSALIAFS